MRFHKLRIRRLILFLLLFLSTGIAYASEILDGEFCNVPSDQVITGDVFVLCSDLTVNGHIQGHLMGAARTTTIRGQVDGSIYLIGGELSVQGEIGKDIHFAGLVLRLEEGMTFIHEQGGIISANLSNTIVSEASVPGSVVNVGYQLIVNGEVGQEISFWGSALYIAGRVGGDIVATVGDSESGGVSSQIQTLLIPFPFEVELVDPGLVLTQTGQIEGQLHYIGPTQGILEGEVSQDPIYVPTERPLTGTTVEQSAQSVQRYLEAVLREFIALAFVGALFLVLAPQQMQAPMRELQVRPLSTLGVGMISFILSFPIVVIIAISSLLIVFILSLLPLDSVVVFGGVVLALANIGGASVFYFTAIYIARLIVALAIGRVLVILLLTDDSRMRYLLLSMAVGVLLLSAAGTVPVVGWGFNALALFLGLGAILSVLRAQMRRFLASGTEASLHYPPESVPLLPFPLSETPVETIENRQRPVTPVRNQQERSLGTDDLPDGFDWWGQEK